MQGQDLGNDQLFAVIINYKISPLHFFFFRDLFIHYGQDLFPASLGIPGQDPGQAGFPGCLFERPLRRLLGHLCRRAGDHDQALEHWRAVADASHFDEEPRCAASS